MSATCCAPDRRMFEAKKSEGEFNIGKRPSKRRSTSKRELDTKSLHGCNESSTCVPSEGTLFSCCAEGNRARPTAFQSKATIPKQQETSRESNESSKTCFLSQPDVNLTVAVRPNQRHHFSRTTSGFYLGAEQPRLLHLGVLPELKLRHHQALPIARAQRRLLGDLARSTRAIRGKARINEGRSKVKTK